MDGDSTTGAHPLRQGEGARPCVGCGALSVRLRRLSLLSFLLPPAPFQKMTSVENDSIIHATYSSIPTDPSLTVLELSIK